MMQSMKGATQLLGSMNRQMNLPALQRIAMEFERENDIMDQRQEMMDDAIDDVTGLEDEEEGEEVVNQVLDEIGVDLNQAVGLMALGHTTNADLDSWAKRHQVCRSKLRRRIGLRKLSVGVVRTTTLRLDWPDCGEDASDPLHSSGQGCHAFERWRLVALISKGLCPLHEKIPACVRDLELLILIDLWIIPRKV
jgi:hypothetical protein